MENNDLLTISPTWRFLDHTTFGPQFDALQSFAYDDTLCTFIGQHDATPTIRAWVHHQTVVLGIQDSRLPHIEKGRALLLEQGFRSIVRNSGGLAVVLDEGVLNVSLILKEEKGLSIDHGYNLMYSLIKSMFASYPVTIDAYEIVGSYCPGSFDLSIAGQKFAGISQRRIRGGVAVQIYLCVTGSGSERAQLIRNFYDQAVQGSPTKFTYPIIQPETMASLSELLGVELSVADVMMQLLKTAQSQNIQLTVQPFSEEEQLLFSDHYDRVRLRNEKALSNI
ncbi:lipoate--protein ligase family protein [Halalkalibacter krulwichiae]|uniref:Octanoyl-[GcvH]:protein N-octanoyltransferase n=1 Tax=Halalkalibacter krulwichiae TaxID=199441 RepID=A0A1X9MLM4_9BACI|nr:lipoate--protein ligase family protein [Halalkalibacter krulwichiae]ARK32811.1 Octanoyl-[GcvH]:protein N-octanoyltransferase [Halalkalibacter krulwichiae]